MLKSFFVLASPSGQNSQNPISDESTITNSSYDKKMEFQSRNYENDGFSTVYENFYRKGDRKMTITFVPELSGIYFFF